MNYSYNDYLARTANKTNNGNQSEGPNVVYLSSLLKTDGSSAIIRFPYTSPDEFDLCQFHEVGMDGNKYPKKIECLWDFKEENNCILCKNKTPLNKRFFLKMIVYVNGVPSPAVFDRPEWFSKQIADKINDFGDLSKHLFKIVRDGVSTKTNYRIEGPLNLLKPQMYNDEIYNPDISSIKDLVPHILFIKKQDKFFEENQDLKNKLTSNVSNDEQQNEIKDVNNQGLPGLETQPQNPVGQQSTTVNTQDFNGNKPKRTYNYNL